MSVIQRVTDRLADIYGSPRAAQAAAEELQDAGLLATEPKSGMLENGDTFGDEDDGPEGGHSEFDTGGDPEAIRASLVEMVDRWEPDGGTDRSMWLRAREALGLTQASGEVKPCKRCGGIPHWDWCPEKTTSDAAGDAPR
jgi:hypothetical protein